MGVISNLLISMLLSETTSIFVIGLGIRLNRLYFIWRIGIWSDLILRLSVVAKLTFLQILWNYWHCCDIKKCHHIKKHQNKSSCLILYYMMYNFHFIRLWNLRYAKTIILWSTVIIYLKILWIFKNKTQSRDFYSKHCCNLRSGSGVGPFNGPNTKYEYCWSKEGLKILGQRTIWLGA